MTASKFAALNPIANALDASGGVSTTAYDQQIFKTQATERVGKSFLGADLPSFQAEAAADGYSGGYQADNQPLFSESGPTLSDINQGGVGD